MSSHGDDRSDVQTPFVPPTTTQSQPSHPEQRLWDPIAYQQWALQELATNPHLQPSGRAQTYWGSTQPSFHDPPPPPPQTTQQDQAFESSFSNPFSQSADQDPTSRSAPRPLVSHQNFEATRQRRRRTTERRQPNQSPRWSYLRRSPPTDPGQGLPPTSPEPRNVPHVPIEYNTESLDPAQYRDPVPQRTRPRSAPETCLSNNDRHETNRVIQRVWNWSDNPDWQPTFDESMGREVWPPLTIDPRELTLTRSSGPLPIDRGLQRILPPLPQLSRELTPLSPLPPDVPLLPFSNEEYEEEEEDPEPAPKRRRLMPARAPRASRSTSRPFPPEGEQAATAEGVDDDEDTATTDTPDSGPLYTNRSTSHKDRCKRCIKQRKRCDSRKPTCGNCAGKDVLCEWPEGRPSRTELLERERRGEE